MLPTIFYEPIKTNIINRIILIMKKRRIILFFVYIYLLDSTSFIFGKPLKKIQKNNIDIKGLDKKVKRNLQRTNNMYIKILFKESCEYSDGFKNKYRNGISHIITISIDGKETSK